MVLALFAVEHVMKSCFELRSVMLIFNCHMIRNCGTFGFCLCKSLCHIKEYETHFKKNLKNI